MFEQVIRQSVLGIQASQCQYEHWTGGRDWLSGGAEYVATVQIADRIHRYVDDAGHVTVEHNILETLTHTRGRRPRMGRRVRLPRRGRFDIVVWTPNDHAAGLVEVKTRTVGWSSVRGDVRRVCEALLNFPGLRWGLVAYYMHMEQGVYKPAVQRIATRTDTTARNAKRFALERDLLCDRHSERPVCVSFPDGTTAAWTAEVLAFSRLAQSPAHTRLPGVND